jgi:outer membrane protein TolC
MGNLKLSTSLLTVSAVAVLLAGCYSSKPVPDVLFSNKYTGIELSKRKTLPGNMNTLTVETAKQIAKENNPNYLSTKHALAAATARFYQSFAPYLPRVTAGYGMYEHKDTPASRGGDGSGSRRYTEKNSGISVDWLIFDGLMRTMNMLASKYSKEQAAELNKDALRLLMQAIRIAYNNVLLSKDRIRIAIADELFNRQLYDETKIKYDAGAVPLTDLLNFEIRMHNAQSRVIAQKYQFYTARTILAELMGLTNAELPEDIFPELKAMNEPFPIDVNTYLDMALSSRPDLKAFRSAVIASKYRVASRWGAFLPTLTANVTFGHQRSDWDAAGRWHFSNRAKDQNFSYGFNAQWVLFNGGSRIFQLREAQAYLAESKEYLLEKWISVVANVRQSYADRKRRAEQMTIYEKNLELVKKTRNLIEEEYKAGNASITRLNEAQRDLVVAETNLSTSIVDLENSKANLDAAIGMIE